MTERELIKLEATIRNKMEEIKKQRVSLKDSGIGSLMVALKKVGGHLFILGENLIIKCLVNFL